MERVDTGNDENSSLPVVGMGFFPRISIQLSCYGMEKSQKFLFIPQWNKKIDYWFPDQCHARFLEVIIYIVLFKYGLSMPNVVA